MFAYLKKILSRWYCVFRQGCSTRHCFLIMTEKWRQCLDKWGINGPLLIDLSNAFDCLLHDLSIAKLIAYGFDYDSLVFTQTTSLKGNKEPKLTMPAALNLIYYMVFHKVPYFSVFILVICFTILLNAILPAMLTTTHHTPVTLI